MGFLCVNKDKEKNVSQQEILDQNFLRDNGLSSVSNIQTDVKFCKEIFLSPEYYVTNAVKLVSGYTTTMTGCTTGSTNLDGIYNLSYTGDINVNFIITGNTGFTLYNGSFCIKTFTKENFRPLISNGILSDKNQFLSDCFPFSSITSTTLTKTYAEGILPKTWGEYLIRPYYLFESKECNPGINFNSWVSTPQNNSFNNVTDFYFMTVVNPPTPVLNPPEGTNNVGNFNLITDKLYVDGYSSPRGSQSINGELNYFLLTTIPSNGQIMLILNGIQLTQDYDFRLVDQGYGVPPVVEILNGNTVKTTDWLLATYIASIPQQASTSVFGSYFIDSILVSNFTNTSTNSYRIPGDNSLNYNPVTLNYEFFTTLPIDPTYALVVTVNGLKLAEEFQYFKSTSFDGRIIFNKNVNFNIGDVISVLAVSKSNIINGTNNYGSLKTNQFKVQWTVPTTFTNNSVTSKFIIQAYNNDTNILTNQVFVDYVDGQSSYETTLTNLSLNINFKFKVTLESTYTGYLNNKVVTCSYAEGYFDTTNAYINNTY
jgi:hypothetical protein